MGSEEKDGRYYAGYSGSQGNDLFVVWGCGTVICGVLLSIIAVIFGIIGLDHLYTVDDPAEDSVSGLFNFGIVVVVALNFLWVRWLLNGRSKRERRAKERAEERRVQVQRSQADEQRKRIELKAKVKKDRDALAKRLAAARATKSKLAKQNPEDVPARIPRDADDFETVCAEWMKKAGFSNVERTPKGPDGGIDTIASDAVGQAKFHPSQKVTGESVRALVGSKVERKKKRALFFHYGPGYTPDAIEAARSTGVELYQLDVSKRRFKRIDK